MAEEFAAARPPSRRQAHKLRTERALQQAALDLFAEQGYDTTTTDEIAERAGVSPRTFFRYFSTKESVLFAGEYGWFQSFTTQFLAQPADLSDLEAMRATLHALAPDLNKTRRALVLYERAVASSPTLRGGVLDRLERDIITIAEAIGSRRDLADPDLACTALATMALMTYRSAIKRWIAGPASADLRDLIAEGFDALAAELPTALSAPRRRSLRSANR